MSSHFYTRLIVTSCTHACLSRVNHTTKDFVRLQPAFNCAVKSILWVGIEIVAQPEVFRQGESNTLDSRLIQQIS